MSTSYTATVLNVLNTISDFRGENDTNTDARRIRAISRSEKSLAKRTNWKLFYLPDQTITTDGSATYALGSSNYPLKQKGLMEIYVGGTGSEHKYQIIEPFEFKDRFSRKPTDHICYTTYDPVTDSWNVTISPTPDDNVTITYSYYWMPPERTATSDVVLCVDMEGLARLSNADLYDGEDEPEKAAIERNKVEQIFSDELSEEDSPGMTQTISFGSTNSGYGNY